MEEQILERVQMTPAQRLIVSVNQQYDNGTLARNMAIMLYVKVDKLSYEKIGQKYLDLLS